MRERIWRFVLGLAVGLALGAAFPALAGISGGGGGGGGGFTQLATDEIDATFDTSSTTFVNITGLSVTATATTNERWLVLAEVLSYQSGGTATEQYYRLDLDSGTVLRDSAHGDTTSGARMGQQIAVVTSALTAASHTVIGRARVAGGTGRWEKDVADTESNSITIEALR